MDEYQIATLELRQVTAWIAGAQVAATLAVGAAQCILIWIGLRFMRRSADARDKAIAEQRREADQRHKEGMEALAEQRSDADRRHAESMEALAQARRDADKRHAEAMEALGQERRDAEERHREAMEALAGQRRGADKRHEEAMRDSDRRHEESMRALEILIERTAPESARPPAAVREEAGDAP